MDSELLYLNKRLNYHRRMARQAAGGEARCAHDALVRAYRARIEELTFREPPAEPEAEPGPAQAPRPIPSPALGQ